LASPDLIFHMGHSLLRRPIGFYYWTPLGYLIDFLENHAKTVRAQ